MNGKKTYLQSKGTILSAISDLAELQKGKLTLSDTPNGKIHFSIKLYHNKWEYRFLVSDIGKNRSMVEIEVDGNDSKTEGVINREFKLLDSILIEGARIELAEKELNTSKANGIAT